MILKIMKRLIAPAARYTTTPGEWYSPKPPSLWKISLILAVPVLIIFGPVIFGFKAINAGDLVYDFYPWKHFLVSEIKDGRLPLWNPYSFSGEPFLHNLQTTIFYPPDWLAVFLPLTCFYGLLYALHVWASGIFMYLLTLRFTRHYPGALLSAILYSWCGFAIGKIFSGFGTMPSTLPYIPLAILICDQALNKSQANRWFLLAFVLALQILAGHPQIPLYTWYLILGYVIYWILCDPQGLQLKFREKIQRSTWLLIAFVFAIGLSAISLLPTMEVVQFSATRGGGAEYGFATHDSLPWLHLLTFLMPLIYGDPTLPFGDFGRFWETSIGYNEICGSLGVIGFFMALYGMRRPRELRQGFFVGVAVFSLILALGSNTYFYKLVYCTLPGFDRFRVPARALCLYSFSMSLLAGWGMQKLMCHRLPILHASKTGAWEWFTLIFMGIISASLFIVWFAPQSIIGVLEQVEIKHQIGDFNLTYLQAKHTVDMIPRQLFITQLMYIRLSISILFVLIILWALICHLVVIKPKYSRLGFLLLLLVTLLELAGIGRHLIPYKDRTEFYNEKYPNSSIVKFIKQDDDLFRIMVIDDILSFTLRKNHPELYPNAPMMYSISTVRGYQPTILNYYVSYINLMQGWAPGTPPGGLLFLQDLSKMNRQMVNALNVKYVITTRPAPEGFTPVYRDKQAIIYRNESYLPRAYIYDASNDKIIRAEIDRYTPNEIEATVTAPSENILVFSEIWYPGWQAWIDGTPVDILKINSIFRGVPVNAGKHKVTMEFRPPVFFLGLLTTLLTMFVIILVIIRDQSRKKIKKSGVLNK